MTSREKVLSVYPDAHCEQIVRGTWNVVYGDDPEHPGFGNLGPDAASEQQAWKLLASKLPSAPSPAGETASEPAKCPNCNEPLKSHGEQCRRCGFWDKRGKALPRSVPLDSICLCIVDMCPIHSTKSTQPAPQAADAVPEPVSTEGAAERDDVVKQHMQDCHAFRQAILRAAPIAPAAEEVTHGHTWTQREADFFAERNAAWAKLTAAEELFRLILFKYGTVTPKMERWIREWLGDVPAASPVAGVSAEVFYVIERTEGTPTALYMRDRGGSWTHDIHLASKWNASADAEDVWRSQASHFRESSAVIEHSWLRAKPSAEGDGWIAQVRTALEEIADPENPGITPMCECEHDTDDCCVLANYYCPQCIAGRALRLLPAPPSGQGEVK